MATSDIGIRILVEHTRQSLLYPPDTENLFLVQTLLIRHKKIFLVISLRKLLLDSDYVQGWSQQHLTMLQVGSQVQRH